MFVLLEGLQLTPDPLNQRAALLDYWPHRFAIIRLLVIYFRAEVIHWPATSEGRSGRFVEILLLWGLVSHEWRVCCGVHVRVKVVFSRVLRCLDNSMEVSVLRGCHYGLWDTVSLLEQVVHWGLRSERWRPLIRYRIASGVGSVRRDLFFSAGHHKAEFLACLVILLLLEAALVLWWIFRS